MEPREDRKDTPTATPTRARTYLVEVNPIVSGEVYEVMLLHGDRRHAFMGTLIRMRKNRWYAVPQGRRIKGPFARRREAINFLQSQLSQNLQRTMREAAA